MSEHAQDSLEERVRQVLIDEVLPLLQLDDAGIELLGVEGGVVRVRFGGACGCCPGTIPALLFGLEAELRQRVRGVDYLEAVP
jgi:Fe-S cluster biogenesis protein NfuA